MEPLGIEPRTVSIHVPAIGMRKRNHTPRPRPPIISGLRICKSCILGWKFVLEIAGGARDLQLPIHILSFPVRQEPAEISSQQSGEAWILSEAGDQGSVWTPGRQAEVFESDESQVFVTISAKSSRPSNLEIKVRWVRVQATSEIRASDSRLHRNSPHNFATTNASRTSL